jgi:hypothetical protein
MLQKSLFTLFLLALIPCISLGQYRDIESEGRFTEREFEIAKHQMVQTCGRSENAVPSPEYWWGDSSDQDWPSFAESIETSAAGACGPQWSGINAGIEKSRWAFGQSVAIRAPDIGNNTGNSRLETSISVCSNCRNYTRNTGGLGDGQRGECNEKLQGRQCNRPLDYWLDHASRGKDCLAHTACSTTDLDKLMSVELDDTCNRGGNYRDEINGIKEKLRSLQEKMVEIQGEVGEIAESDDKGKQRKLAEKLVQLANNQGMQTEFLHQAHTAFKSWGRRLKSDTDRGALSRSFRPPKCPRRDAYRLDYKSQCVQIAAYRAQKQALRGIAQRNRICKSLNCPAVETKTCEDGIPPGIGEPPEPCLPGDPACEARYCAENPDAPECACQVGAQTRACDEACSENPTAIECACRDLQSDECESACQGNDDHAHCICRSEGLQSQACRDAMRRNSGGGSSGGGGRTGTTAFTPNTGGGSGADGDDDGGSGSSGNSNQDPNNSSSPTAKGEDSSLSYSLKGTGSGGSLGGGGSLSGGGSLGGAAGLDGGADAETTSKPSKEYAPGTGAGASDERPTANASGGGGSYDSSSGSRKGNPFAGFSGFGKNSGSKGAKSAGNKAQLKGRSSQNPAREISNKPLNLFDVIQDRYSNLYEKKVFQPKTENRSTFSTGSGGSL